MNYIPWWHTESRQVAQEIKSYFKLGTLKERKAVKEGFENVILSHREFWHKPSNLQTNQTERSEVKIVVNVWPPYIQTSNSFGELSLMFPSITSNVSFKEM